MTRNLHVRNAGLRQHKRRREVGLQVGRPLLQRLLIPHRRFVSPVQIRDPAIIHEHVDLAAKDLRCFLAALRISFGLRRLQSCVRSWGCVRGSGSCRGQRR